MPISYSKHYLWVVVGNGSWFQCNVNSDQSIPFVCVSGTVYIQMGKHENRHIPGLLRADPRYFSRLECLSVSHCVHKLRLQESSGAILSG